MYSPTRHRLSHQSLISCHFFAPPEYSHDYDKDNDDYYGSIDALYEHLASEASSVPAISCCWPLAPSLMQSRLSRTRCCCCGRVRTATQGRQKWFSGGRPQSSRGQLASQLPPSVPAPLREPCGYLPKAHPAPAILALCRLWVTGVTSAERRLRKGIHGPSIRGLRDSGSMT
jgi:hypothetical protein